jgi:hypothetical protein
MVYYGNADDVGAEERVMTGLPDAAATCDRRACPAPAQRVVVVHGQDFSFCAHHAAEMRSAFAAAAATEVALADVQHADQIVVLAWRAAVVPAGVPADEL